VTRHLCGRAQGGRKSHKGYKKLEKDGAATEPDEAAREELLNALAAEQDEDEEQEP
jgi:hypothetical protein